MPNPNTLKPGVYTDYTLSPVFSPNKGKTIGVIATSTVAGQLLRVTSLADAKRLFAPTGQTVANDQMMAMLTAIYLRSSPIVLAIGVTADTDENYRSALAQLLDSEASILVCGSTRRSVCVESARTIAGYEKLLLVPPASGVDPINYALEMNSPRVCLAAPEIHLKSGGSYNVAPALLAVLLSKTTDPTKNLIGESVGEEVLLPTPLSSDLVEPYLQRGICVFEQHGGTVELIRAMTTSTKDADGKTDHFTYRNVSMILIQDAVMGALRETLRSALESARNNQAGLNTILSLLVCRLDDFVEEGLLHDYDLPLVSLDPDESSRCLVTVGFRIMQGLSIIHLTALISV